MRTPRTCGLTYGRALFAISRGCGFANVGSGDFNAEVTEGTENTSVDSDAGQSRGWKREEKDGGGDFIGFELVFSDGRARERAAERRGRGRACVVAACGVL